MRTGQWAGGRAGWLAGWMDRAAGWGRGSGSLLLLVQPLGHRTAGTCGAAPGESSPLSPARVVLSHSHAACGTFSALPHAILRLRRRRRAEASCAPRSGRGPGGSREAAPGLSSRQREPDRCRRSGGSGGAARPRLRSPGCSRDPALTEPLQPRGQEPPPTKRSSPSSWCWGLYVPESPKNRLGWKRPLGSWSPTLTQRVILRLVPL